MKRFGLAIFSLALVFALATGVDAQVKTGGKNDSARAITISGSTDFTFVHRSEGMNEVLDNEYRRATPAGGVTSRESVAEDQNWTRGYFNLRFDVELAEKVSAVLELENRVLENRLLGGGVAGSANGGTGSQANLGVIGGGANDFSSATSDQTDQFAIHLGQLYIEVKEFLWQQLSFKLGIQDHRYDLRGNGNAFFMDVREAELAYARPLAESFAGNIYFGHTISAADANAEATLNGGVFRDQNRDAGGVKFTYNMDDNLFVDLFYFQTLETAINDPSANGDAKGRFDEYVIGMNIDYNIDEKSLLNFIYAGIYGDEGHVNVHTLGIGVDYYLTPEFEAYLEFYGQWGTSGSVRMDTFSATADTSNEEIDHSAYAGVLGLKYTFDHEIKPWIDASWTYISGDDGDIGTNDTTNNPDPNHDFISYEDNDATMILEENEFGLDLDSNYWKLQFDMGFTVSLDRQDDFHFTTSVAWAELNHVPDRAGVAPGSNNLFDDNDGGSGDDDDDDNDYNDLGVEWDIKMTWNYTESLDFTIGWAWLFTGDNSFWHGQGSEDTGSTGGPGIGVRDGFAVSEGEDLWMLTIDAKLKF